MLHTQQCNITYKNIIHITRKDFLNIEHISRNNLVITNIRLYIEYLPFE